MKKLRITNQNCVFQQMEEISMKESPIIIKDYKFNPVTEKDIAFFMKICGKEHVLKRNQIVEDFARDEMTPEHLWKYPEVMVEVINAKQISEILKHCNKHNIPVTPRGQGTGLCGGCIPLYGGVLLNMSTYE